jgi:glycosyltransferase involved in cell wall biosynthesis
MRSSDETGIASESPAISVIVPVYNKSSYICRTLESVCAQSFKNFEIVVVDDGSTDGSDQIISEFRDPRMRSVRQENRGQSVATNAAIRLAKGELLAFLDGDDEWHPDHLADLMELRGKYPDAGILATGYERWHSRGLRVQVCIAPEFVAGNHGEVRDCFAKGVYGQVFWTGAVAIPRHVFDEVGFFLEGELRAQDIEMWARVALRFSAAFHSHVSATYHCDAEGRGMDLGLVWYPPFARVVDKMDFSKTVPANAQKHLIDYKNKQLFSYVARCASKGKGGEARKTLMCDMEMVGCYRFRIFIFRVCSIVLPVTSLPIISRILGSRYFHKRSSVRNGAQISIR